MASKRSNYMAQKAAKGTVYKGPKTLLNPTMMKSKKKMTQAQDDAYDRKHGIKEGSKRDQIQDAKNGIMEKKAKKNKKAKSSVSGPIKHTGKFNGKSNALGQGGRAAQMKARNVPGGVIGAIARAEGAAPGQKNFHKGKGKK